MSAPDLDAIGRDLDSLAAAHSEWSQLHPGVLRTVPDESDTIASALDLSRISLAGAPSHPRPAMSDLSQRLAELERQFERDQSLLGLPEMMPASVRTVEEEEEEEEEEETVACDERPPSERRRARGKKEKKKKNGRRRRKSRGRTHRIAGVLRVSPVAAAGATAASSSGVTAAEYARLQRTLINVVRERDALRAEMSQSQAVARVEQDANARAAALEREVVLLAERLAAAQSRDDDFADAVSTLGSKTRRLAELRVSEKRRAQHLRRENRQLRSALLAAQAELRERDADLMYAVAKHDQLEKLLHQQGAL